MAGGEGTRPSETSAKAIAGIQPNGESLQVCLAFEFVAKAAQGNAAMPQGETIT